MNIRNLFKIKSSKLNMQERLFNEILFVAFLVSVINIIGNISISFPFDANYKWFFMIILTLIVHRYKHYTDWIRFGFMGVIIVLLLPLGWYNSGANNNNAIAYVFLIIVAVSFLFTSGKRAFLIACTILVFLSFVVVEYNFPQLLPEHNAQLVMLDRIVQIPLAIIVCFLMLKQFADDYYKNDRELRSLNEELRNMVYTDALTNIYNRAFIFKKLEQSIRSGKHFITLMIDVDDFKLINDQNGHLEGDQILIKLSQLLEAYFSDSGYVARYGGDEFIVMTTIEHDEFIVKANSFLDSFKSIDLAKKYHATVSGGYSVYKPQHELNSHLAMVDRALYVAKESGKNKILIGQ